MISYRKRLHRILKNNYSVRSGVYSAIDPGIKMQMDDYGEYQPIFTGKETDETYRKLLDVDMMSNESLNEDDIANELFKQVDGIQYDPVLGFYSDLYIGYVQEGNYRKLGSSGGFTSWILDQLLKDRKIDGVIHARPVDPDEENGKLFKYVISRTTEDIRNGAKSRYYPLELSEVLALVKGGTDKYAVVGIPEYIMELRLLAKVDPIINSNVKYFVGLVCGHQKTAKYAEALAWQHGIKPGDLKSIDFRVKQPNSSASDYLHELKGKINKRPVKLTKSHSELFGEVWAYGFFKSKFSDFTDNAFNEVADVVLGDAWLPKYNDDGMGNNIIIVRNAAIAKIIKDGIKRKAITLEKVDEKSIKESQRGLIHHIRDELPYRLYRQRLHGKWVPKKRVQPSRVFTVEHKSVQNIRFKMARQSHYIYRKAVLQGDWSYFQKHMSKMIQQYNSLYEVVNAPKKSVYSRLRTRSKILLRNIRTSVRVRSRARHVLHLARLFYFRKKFKNYDGAILTLNGYFNYGNIIQRYALQKYLSKNNYRFVSYALEPLKLKGEDASRFKHTAQFISTYIVRKPYDPKDNFPVYVVGSDQVWRNWSYLNEEKELGYFFLNFLKGKQHKRIAYAASFGKDTAEEALISPEFLKNAKQLISQFDAVSVREQSAINLVNKAWDKKARHVIDPTMLLTKKDYSKLIDSSQHGLHITKPIFTYVLTESEAKSKIINKISEEMGAEFESIKLWMDVAPPVEQWLKGFRDAELVITDSFHGAVFSLINSTPFIIIENREGGLARMTSLLKQFGLKDRLIAEADADNISTRDFKPIDWEKVNKRVQEARTSSGSWLLDQLPKKN